MDTVFDIDGTLADASHRLPYITNPHVPKNWTAFIDSAVDDKPIAETWEILTALVQSGNRVLFITGRPERTRIKTYDWLTNPKCPIRCIAQNLWSKKKYPALYMRGNDDLRTSSEVKRDLLHKARMDGFKPRLAFEDRADDASMWREEGLLCCQVNEGNF